MRSPSLWARVLLCLAGTALMPVSAADKLINPKAEEKPISGTGAGVEVTATVTDDRFTYGQISGPSFKLSVIIKNFTTLPLELGDSIIVLEKEQGSDAFASSYVSRERAKAAKASSGDPFSGAFSGGLKGSSVGVRRRYQLDWGEDIDAGGSALLAFVGGGRFSVTFSNPGVYEGLGWGRVSARSQRTITHDLAFPYKIRGKREYLAVVLPWARPISKTASTAVATILKFEPAQASREAGYKLLETTRVPLNAAELQKVVSNTGLETWRRVFALNWLVEASPKTAVPLLITTVPASGGPEMMRISAAANLGMLKEKSAVQPMLEVLAAAKDDKERIWSMEALGAIGDVAAAGSLRSYFDNKEDRVANAAIEAAGKVKDPESVAPLLAILNEKARKERHGEAAGALAEIGTGAAVDGLIGVLRSGTDATRELAADKLGVTGSSAAVAPLAAVVADAKAKESMRSKALASLGKLGGPEALASLRTGAASDKDQVRRAALSAMIALKENAGVPSLIELVEKPGYPSKDDAVRELRQAKKSEALPALRKLVADPKEAVDARQAACSALSELGDKQGVEALRAALGDSNKGVYESALSALRSIAGAAADDATIAALKSTQEGVRRTAVNQVKEGKIAAAAGPLWESYKVEKNEWIGSTMAEALIAAGFSDAVAVDFLLARLDPKANKLWYSDVEILRHLSKQEIGPKSKYGDDKERDAGLQKWREWGASRK